MLANGFGYNPLTVGRVFYTQLRARNGALVPCRCVVTRETHFSESGDTVPVVGASLDGKLIPVAEFHVPLYKIIRLETVDPNYEEIFREAIRKHLEE